MCHLGLRAGGLLNLIARGRSGGGSAVVEAVAFGISVGHWTLWDSRVCPSNLVDVEN
jgi:hypothetical protein